jgi:hypothetical protein
MRKKNISILFFVLIFVFTTFPMKGTLLSAELVQEEQANTESSKQVSQDPEEIILKTYSLKFVNPLEIKMAAKLFLFESTVTDDTITVRICRKDIPRLEELIKRLDVEKKTILIKVYTVIASKEKEPQEDEAIENKDLRKVLDELRGLWNFKSYKVDGPSFLTIREDSGLDSFRLVSSVSNFYMHIVHAKVKGEEAGKRHVSIGQIQLKWRTGISAEHEQTLINTSNITIKENGYLVAGISGYGFSGKDTKALILIINAEIK